MWFDGQLYCREIWLSSRPSRIDNCEHRATSISDSGSYSASVTRVSEMSTESLKIPVVCHVSEDMCEIM